MEVYWHTSRIKVIVADKNEVYREGLARLLQSTPNIEVVSVCSTGLEVIECASKYQPDVILLDTELSNCGYMQAIRLINQRAPKINIIILTFSESERDFLSAVKMGITGYLSKDISLTNLVKMITLVKEADIVIFLRSVSKIITELETVHTGSIPRRSGGSDSLSTREKEVLTLVSKGFSNKDIAAKLFISENTVKVHMQKILDKLHAKNRQEAAAWAIAKGSILRNSSDVGTH
jgi:DNA-binding NarL/FixJ family response regulator